LARDIQWPAETEPGSRRCTPLANTAPSRRSAPPLARARGLPRSCTNFAAPDCDTAARFRQSLVTPAPEYRHARARISSRRIAKYHRIMEHFGVTHDGPKVSTKSVDNFVENLSVAVVKLEQILEFFMFAKNLGNHPMLGFNSFFSCCGSIFR
jgi:hypothetical protein